MEDWGKRFVSYLNSGVYTLTKGTEADIKNAAKVSGLDFVKVDLKPITSKTDFLKILAAALGFPGYFGMNWDAFSDCLTDMAWRPAAGYVILLINFRSFVNNYPADAGVARRIFDSSAQFWKQRKVPFYVILRDRVTRGSSP